MTDRLMHAVSGRIVVLTVIGANPADELLAAVDAAISDPRAPRPVCLLIDVRQSTADRERAEIEQIVERIGAWSDRIARIALVGGSDLQFGLVRMASMIAQRFKLYVAPFRDLESATAFLNDSFE